MTNEEILQKAIGKAQDYGFDSNLKLYPEDLIREDHYQAIIFSHDFAKAFWGDIAIPEGNRGQLLAWQYHLQQMVLEEDPIKYLEQFLDENKGAIK